MIEKIKNIFSASGASIASLLKVILMSKRPSASVKREGDTLVVMGNGPSLRDAVDNHRALLEQNRLMSVNFAPLTPEFFSLQPDFHILADGIFFEKSK